MSAATEVRERPILFSGGMVRAILDGRKAQTRRVVKPQPPSDAEDLVRGDACEWVWRWANLDVDPEAEDSLHQHVVPCPYGQPGDRLWVRETWDVGFTSDEQWVRYRADERHHPIPEDRREALIANWDNYASPGWRPSIHMPRWASRITLELTDVRVERVQEISEQDCEAELGVPAKSLCVPPRTRFASLWDSINAKRGYDWDANPWVWALSFRVVAP